MTNADPREKISTNELINKFNTVNNALDNYLYLIQQLKQKDVEIINLRNDKQFLLKQNEELRNKLNPTKDHS